MKIIQMKTEIEKNFPVSTLYDCSLDDEGKEHLVQNKSFEVYNFDKISEQWMSSPIFKGCSKICSPDSIYISGKKIYLIEFKNSFFRKIEKPLVRAKLYEFIVMAQLKFQFEQEQIKEIVYILVHKDEDKPKTHALKEGKCPPDLMILKKYFSIKVMVYEASVFNRKYSSILK